EGEAAGAVEGEDGGEAEDAEERPAEELPALHREGEEVLDPARREQARGEVGAGEDAEAEAAVEDDIRGGAKDGAERDVDRADVGVEHLAEEPRRRERPVDHVEAQREAEDGEQERYPEAEREEPAARRGLPEEIEGDGEQRAEGPRRPARRELLGGGRAHV